MTWVDGWGSQLRLDGRARDAVTTVAGTPPVVLGLASASVGVGPNRTIEDIVAEPDSDGLQSLVGCRGGGYLRAALAEFLGHELDAGTPLYLLLDDISGSSLIAGFAWSQWTTDWAGTPEQAAARPDMEGVCIGFAPGSSALIEVRSGKRTHRVQPVPALVRVDDPDGWHDLGDLPPVSMRRARRIDVWRDPSDGTIMIDSAFQDSAGNPDHGRVAIHEYGLRATADSSTLTITSVEPTAHILPFRSCTAAVDTASVVLGAPLADLRMTVLERLARTAGCTHLNDALRALAEVPVLLERLDRAVG
ncbi:MAG: hypothetical protein RLZZ623_1753 [Actinomycetota bacterium]|jgi:Protein of unknown function (DUF2889)